MTTTVGAHLQLNQQVVVAGYSGTIRFIGETKFAHGDDWVGIELDEALGKNDGSVQGERYFQCGENRGIFVRANVVRPVAASQKGAGEADDGKSDSSDSEPGEAPKPRQQSDGPRPRRRLAVSAEDSQKMSQGGDHDVDWSPPVYGKSQEERRQLCEIIRTSKDSKLQIMFGNIPNDTFEQVIDAMFMKRVARGENVIREGDVGDYFYIVKAGNFDIIKNVKDSAPIKVFEAGPGFAFGELALLYNANRSATITAVLDSEVWALERLCFRNLVVKSAELKFRGCVDFLKRCEIFEELDDEQIAALAEVVEEESFDPDEVIIEQGEKDDKMYILQEGEAVAAIMGDEGEVDVMRYNAGNYFGEIALLTGEPRKASVYAVTPATCYYICRYTFSRVLGPLQDFLERNIEKYTKYKDAMRAESATKLSELSSDLTREVSGEMEVFEGKAERTLHKSARKRDRARIKKEEDMSQVKGNARAATKDGANSGSEAAEGAEPPTSLKEKIAHDFKTPALVKPSPQFAIPSAKNVHFKAYGGLRLGEKFTLDKVLLVDNKVEPPTSDGLEDTFSWSAPSRVKGSIEVAIACQKGQKSASDPTPNQDNYFVLNLESYSIYGVFDGHGPFGHLVSFRLVQSMPCLLTSNNNFGKDWESCLKESFVAAQQELLDFCKEFNINVEASGAAGSVLVFDGTAVHVAHIGDASVMVASWNRRDTRLIYGTKDHKPQNPEEQARLEAAGSEVRKVDEESYRIYLPGSTFPGLTMSRAFGDTACKGVLQEPEYNQFFMQPQSDEWYAIVASDGIWEFIDFEKAVELTAKKLRLKGARETVRFLVEASRKRWAYCCGEYCDDITAILIQWNVQHKEKVQWNHTVQVSRHE